MATIPFLARRAFSSSLAAASARHHAPLSSDIDQTARILEDAQEHALAAQSSVYNISSNVVNPDTVRFVRLSDFKERPGAFRPPRKVDHFGPDRPTSEARDLFRQLDIDPLYEATNSRLLANFVTEMGKVKGRAYTNLTWRSQRRISKAIRRAKMMGTMPILYREQIFVNHLD